MPDPEIDIIDQLVDTYQAARNLRYELAELGQFATETDDPRSFRKVVDEFEARVREIVSWLNRERDAAEIRERRRRE